MDTLLYAAPADRLFEDGLAQHRAGMLDQAIALYEQALALEPRHFDALHHIGIVAWQSADHQVALQFLGAAIEVDDAVSAAWSNLGNVFKATERHELALQAYRKALQLDQGNVDAHYNRANTLQALGRYGEALDGYDDAIALVAHDAQAWNNRAVVLQELGRLEPALASCAQALALQPDDAEAHNNHGNLLLLLGRPEAALASYDQAIACRPGWADAHANRAKALKQLDRLDAALADVDRALALMPGHAESYNTRGNILARLKRHEEALASYDAALAQRNGFGDALTNRGLVLQQLERYEAALDSYDAALAHDRSSAVAHNGRGATLEKLRRFEEALASFEAALALDPDYADAHLNRGVALQQLRRFDAALACYEHAAALTGETADIHANRANLYAQQAQFDAALRHFDLALALDPAHGIAQWNRAVLLLRHGHYRAGWAAYECRWHNEQLNVFRDARAFAQPLWLGREPLAGKTILLYAEQGLGDTLQFCRYAALVAALGARVILEVQPALAGLVAGLAGASQVIARGEPLPPFDYRCPLLSLPLAFATTLDTIPAPRAYLQADPARVAAWATVLGPRTRPRVGIVWSGNDKHRNDHNRSLALAQFAQALDGRCEFVALQKDIRAADQALLEARGVRQFGARLDDFRDTAALCALMDVVLTVDTSVAHLAGALGKPAWVLVAAVSDWRWLVGCADSPWYPGATLYRQGDDGAWDPVLARVRGDLAMLAK